MEITRENWTPPNWKTMSLDEYKARVRYWRNSLMIVCPPLAKLTENDLDIIAEMGKSGLFKRGGFWQYAVLITDPDVAKEITAHFESMELEIDLSDIPEAGKEWFEKAKLRLPETRH